MTDPSYPREDAMPPTDKTSELFQEGLALHRAMIASDAARDRTAFARVCDTYYDHLIRALERKYPNYPDDAIYAEAAWEALRSYHMNPAIYKPELANAKSLYGFLFMAADRDLLNLFKRYKKYMREESLSQSVENHNDGQEYEREIAAPDDVEQQIIDAASPLMDAINRELPNARDQVFARLMMDGVRETPPFAELLEITHLSADEQAREVKRHKDRIKKRLQRSEIRRELLQNE